LTQVPFDPSALLLSESYRRILSLEETVNPFEVYGIQSDELAHSRILGRLLASEGALSLGPALIPRLATCLRMVGTREALDGVWLARLGEARFRVKLEYPCMLDNPEGSQSLGRLDILLEDGARKVAIVIENKIWAGEQAMQIERYQTWLAKERKGWETLVIYLTPTGSDPTTHRLATGLPPCACLGWKDVASALESEEDKDISGVIRSFRHNITRYIMGESEAKTLVREMLADHEFASVFKTILANMPQLSDIQMRLVDGVAAATGLRREELDVKIYPSSRGPVREIMITPVPWSRCGAHVCFNFYHGDWPSLRTMIHQDHWSESKEVLRKLAAAFPDVIHATCPLRSDWSAWRLVMADDADTDEAWASTIVKDLSFTDATANSLLALFQERYLKIKPAMDALVGDPARFRG